MPTPTKGARLGGGPAHERLMLANLAQSLFEHGRITTTATRARRLRPYAERLITFAKRGDLASRRRVMGVLHDKSVVHALFTEIGPSFAERSGGYTRITKVGVRKGDSAPLAVIELVEGPLSDKQSVVSEATKAAKKSAKKSAKLSESKDVASKDAAKKPAKADVEEAPVDEGAAEAEAPEADDAESSK